MGIHPFGRHTDVPLAELAARAVDEALARADIPMRRIDEVFVGNALGHSGVAAAVAEAIGADQLPVTRVEQACASSSTALRLAADAVASGRRQNVLAIGVEKMAPGLLDLGDDASYVSLMGLDVLPLLYGLKACQYLSQLRRSSRRASAHRLGGPLPWRPGSLCPVRIPVLRGGRARFSDDRGSAHEIGNGRQRGRERRCRSDFF